MIKKILIFISLGALFLRAADEVRIGTQNTAELTSLAIAAGFVKEEFEKIGAKVKIVEFDSGREMNAAFAAKSIDFGHLGSPPFVIGAVNDIGVSVFYIDHIAYGTEGLAARKNKFKSIKDIKGAKIAVPFGTSAHYALLQSLKINQISPKEVQILDIPASSIQSAYDRGDVDLAFVWELYLSALKDKELLYTDKDLADNGVIIASVVVARTAFAKEHPEAFKAFKVALNRAYELLQNEPQKAYAIFAKHFSLDEKIVSYLFSAKQRKTLSLAEQTSKNLLGTAQKPGQFNEQFYLIAQFLKEQNLLRKVPPKDKFKEFIFY